MRRLLVLEAVFVAILNLVVAIGLHRVFTGREFFLSVFLAVVFAIGVSVVAHLRKLSWTAALLLSVVGYVIFTIYGVLTDTNRLFLPTGATFSELAGGLTGGWADLLTETLPTRAEPRLLIVVTALVWISAAASFELLFRSRQVLGPLIAPLLAYVITLALSATQPRSPTALPLLIGGVSLVVLLLHVNRLASIEPGGLRLSARGSAEAITDHSTVRTIANGLPVVVAAVAVATLVGMTVPSGALRKPWDLRDARRPRVLVTPITNPLVVLRDNLRLDPPVTVLTLDVEAPVAVSGLAAGRLRVATLDLYDGATWTSDATFRKVGNLLPEQNAPTIPRQRVRATVNLQRPQSPWLVLMDRPVRVDVPDVQATTLLFDAESATLQVGAGERNDLTYQVSALITDPGLGNPETYTMATGKAFAAERTLPDGIPEKFSALAQQLTRGATTPYSRLQALELGLRSGYGYSDQVEAGHSIGRLDMFLSNARKGYSEQFAASFALLARELGFPTRLAVGYLLSEPVDAVPLTSGRITVTSHSSHVWPEVYLTGAGWVAFEPTPTRVASDPPPSPVDTAVTNRPGGLVEERNSVPDTLDEPELPIPRHRGLSARWSVVIGVVFALITCAFLVPLAKRMLRGRRRRRASTPADRVLGAWSEVVDRLLELGIPLRRSMTTRQVVQCTEGALPQEAVAHLDAMAPAVTEALFSPEQPAEELAQDAWDHAASFDRTARANCSARRRLTAWFNPRPLIYHAGSQINRSGTRSRSHR